MTTTERYDRGGLMELQAGQVRHITISGDEVDAQFIAQDPEDADCGVYRILTDHPTHPEYRAGRIFSIRAES